jgi:hypothetical protein
MKNETLDTEPWYKQFWPWVLIGLPGSVVIACMVTIVIAVKTQDGMVVDDYYKQGLAINQSLERDHNAAALDLSAIFRLSPETNMLELQLTGNAKPGPVRLKLLHATIADLDQTLDLNTTNNAILKAEIAPLKAGKWYLQLESEPGNWRVAGQIHYPKEMTTRLIPQASADSNAQE